MKKISLLIILLLVSCYFVQLASAAEQINSFQSVITINSDASINVEETIVYDFAGEQKHGIFRNIVTQDQSAGLNLEFSDVQVANENGQPYKFQVSKNGIYTQIKIGDPNLLISGQQTYQINYRLTGVILPFEDHDEFYWNVTGNEWPNPINQAKAVVNLPAQFRVEQLEKDCYRGVYGSKEKCSSSAYIFNQQQLVNQVVFEDQALAVNAGLTIVVGFPKGAVIFPAPTFWEALRPIIYLAFSVFLVILSFVICFRRWYKYGRDARGRGTIVTQFDPPDRLTPLAAGTLLDGVGSKDFSAEIIYLAIKGYLRIRQLPAENVFQKTDYLLEKLPAPPALAEGLDQELIERLFDGQNKRKISQLKNKFNYDFQQLSKKTYQQLTDKGYFKKHPSKARLPFLSVGVVLLCLAWVFFSFTEDFRLAGGWLVSGLIFLIFGWLMAAYTEKGALAREHLLGLRNYIKVAEAERIKFHNAPEKNPQLFEKLLPFAMIFGLEKGWAAQFKDIYRQPPNWYAGYGTMTNFNALVLVNSLSSFKAQASQAFHGAAQGHSGLGGGGFSGGGFGGGGGGSW